MNCDAFVLDAPGDGEEVSGCVVSSHRPQRARNEHGVFVTGPSLLLTLCSPHLNVAVSMPCHPRCAHRCPPSCVYSHRPLRSRIGRGRCVVSRSDALERVTDPLQLPSASQDSHQETPLHSPYCPHYPRETPIRSLVISSLPEVDSGRVATRHTHGQKCQCQRSRLHVELGCCDESHAVPVVYCVVLRLP